MAFWGSDIGVSPTYKRRIERKWREKNPCWESRRASAAGLPRAVTLRLSWWAHGTISFSKCRYTSGMIVFCSIHKIASSVTNKFWTMMVSARYVFLRFEASNNVVVEISPSGKLTSFRLGNLQHRMNPRWSGCVLVTISMLNWVKKNTMMSAL